MEIPHPSGLNSQDAMVLNVQDPSESQGLHQAQDDFAVLASRRDENAKKNFGEWHDLYGQGLPAVKQARAEAVKGATPVMSPDPQNDKNLICSVCFKSTSKSSATRHILEVHEKDPEKILFCPYCEHHPDRCHQRHPCNDLEHHLCNKSFFRPSAIDDHLVAKHCDFRNLEGTARRYWTDPRSSSKNLTKVAVLFMTGCDTGEIEYLKSKREGLLWRFQFFGWENEGLQSLQAPEIKAWEVVEGMSLGELKDYRVQLFDAICEWQDVLEDATRGVAQKDAEVSRQVISWEN